ncbi:hypothetical protein, partial [Salmonella sp. SAL4434]|uniref:hypothetical protein n=1 Tax=Salmonella sp. SAL4434 TaxID=3159889 RepID=UPI00397DD762
PQAVRTIGDVRGFSPPITGFLVAPAESTLWGGLDAHARSKLGWPPEMAFDVGYALLVLAGYGAVRGQWPRRRRIALAAGAGGVLVLA